MEGTNIKVQSLKSTGSENQPTTSVWQQKYDEIYEHFGVTQLHLACVVGDRDLAAAIIDQTKSSEQLDIQNFLGQTALHLAALNEQVHILRMLILAGAKPNLRDHDGNTALHLACNANNEESVSALITTCGAINGKLAPIQTAPIDLEIRNYNGQRCTHLAAQSGNLSVLRILLNSGADINAREGIAGRTPLHLAIELNNDDMVRCILKNYLTTVNLVTATYAGCTVYQAALAFKKLDFYNLIKTCLPQY